MLLTAVAFAAAGAAALATLLWAGAFPDPSPSSPANRVLAEGRGWSAVTLLLALPLGVLALRAALRGSIRGRLAWLGVLVYVVYAHLELAVSPPFTPLYLVYVTAFACAVPALVLGAASVDAAALPSTFGASVPRRTVGVFLLGVSSLLATTWLVSIARRTLAGAPGWPVGEDAVGHVVQALDLGLQVPFGIAAGVLLLRRSPAGLLLAALALVNGVCMSAALTGMVLAAAADAGTSARGAAPFVLLAALEAALALRFFGSGLRPRREALRRVHA